MPIVKYYTAQGCLAQGIAVVCIKKYSGLYFRRNSVIQTYKMVLGRIFIGFSFTSNLNKTTLDLWQNP